MTNNPQPTNPQQPVYRLDLDAFELGALQALVTHPNAPLTLRMKIKQLTEQAYSNSGYTPEEVHEQPED